MTSSTGTPPTDEPRPAIRLRGPEQLVASIPMLIGFEPAESLVAIAFSDDPFPQAGMSLRIDLAMSQDVPAMLEEVATRMIHAGARRVVAALYPLDDLGWTSEALREPALAELMLDRVAPLAGILSGYLEAAGVALDDFLVVVGDRFWSATCANPVCCPLEGRQIGSARQAAPVQALAAERVMNGRASFGRREDLVASIGAPRGTERKAVLRAQREAVKRRDADLARRGDAARLSALDRFETALRTFAEAPGEPVADASDLVVWFSDILVRDEVTAMILGDEADTVLALLIRLASRAVHPHDAPVCSVLSWMAICQGDGALANVAIDRALRSDAHYSMALLAAESVNAQITPDQLREVLRSASGEGLLARGRKAS